MGAELGRTASGLTIGKGSRTRRRDVGTVGQKPKEGGLHGEGRESTFWGKANAKAGSQGREVRAGEQLGGR